MLFMNSDKVVKSQYRQIAADIAEQIANGKYKQGEKLFGRSMLASHYKVSPETIRKAVFLLKDVGIVDTEKGSGIEIISKKKAEDFIQRNSKVENLASIKKEIDDWTKEQANTATNIMHKIQYIINETERINMVSPLNPFQIRITANASVIGKTAGDLQFWHLTGGTITAIRRGESLIVSPGPYATFCEDDLFFIIGDEAAYSAAMKLIFE